MELYHIAIAVNSISDTAKWYTSMGYTLSEIIEDPIQNVQVAFLDMLGGILIELVQPVDKTSPVCNILQKTGVSPYHFCYEVNDMRKTVEELEKQDFKILVEPVEAIAFDNRKICFLYHIDTGLIELLEK